MKLAMMVAAAENDVIGRDNALPWHLPGELQYFKRTTLGKPVIMGRRTWESLGRPLPGRTNIVVTRQPAYRAEGAVVTGSLEEALRAAGNETPAEAVLIGGAELFGLALPRADRLYLTRVHARVEGDVFFPEVDWTQWEEISRAEHPATGKDGFAWTALVYERRK